jgi:DNA-binding winged helix-turn-helix (wHTH) protein
MTTAHPLYRFKEFELDPRNRRLMRNGLPVEVPSRCLDVLILMVTDAGSLIPKSRFIEEVWDDLAVTDEVLTQSIRLLRRELGDSASQPRLIETVHKHGYRFVASVSMVLPGSPMATAAPDPIRVAQPVGKPWADVLAIGGAGAGGGGLAGVLGGLLYGLVGITDPMGQAGGAMSTLVVVVCVALMIGALGGGGVGLGLGVAWRLRGTGLIWTVAGGAIGGLLVGALVRLLATDALTLMLGHAPARMTGAAEGLVLGALLGLAIALAQRTTAHPVRGSRLPMVAGIGALTGLAIVAAGGQLMAGSLESLADAFADTRLSPDQLGRLTGETEFGPISRLTTGALESGLFSLCVAAFVLKAKSRLSPMSPS